jgi:SAM-dependent methyltransferase
MNNFNPIAYWKQRYQSGGNSGAGSYGRLARFKIDFINALTRDNNILDLLDFGCGDGSIMQHLKIPRYIGVDVSETALAHCRALVLTDPSREFYLRSELSPNRRASMTLSMDVIYHLTDDPGFADYMETLFDSANRVVVIYASNTDLAWNSPHVRHRRFTDYVQWNFPDWRLAAHCPNPYPFKADLPDDTSFADFFIFNRPGEACIIPVPAYT